MNITSETVQSMGGPITTIRISNSKYRATHVEGGSWVCWRNADQLKVVATRNEAEKYIGGLYEEDLEARR